MDWRERIPNYWTGKRRCKTGNKKAESETKAKVSNLIENMYEKLPFNLKEQLELAKENENR